jgi:membrane protein involved in colicin uptake
MALNNLRFEVI